MHDRMMKTNGMVCNEKVLISITLYIYLHRNVDVERHKFCKDFIKCATKLELNI